MLRSYSTSRKTGFSRAVRWACVLLRSWSIWQVTRWASELHLCLACVYPGSGELCLTCAVLNEWIYPFRVRFWSSTFDCTNKNYSLLNAKLQLLIVIMYARDVIKLSLSQSMPDKLFLIRDWKLQIIYNSHIISHFSTIL